VLHDIQGMLASVRTDLDSFSWLESDALMVSGYRMTDSEWKKCLPKFPISDLPPVAWEFQKLDPAISGDGTDAELNVLRKGLEAAASLAFKPFKLSKARLAATLAILAVVIAALVWVVPGEAWKWLGLSQLALCVLSV